MHMIIQCHICATEQIGAVAILSTHPAQILSESLANLTGLFL